MKAMIFAAGMGTRLKPMTDNTPKALIPINGRPMLEHVILKLKDAGFHQIVINVHHLGDQIIDFLAANNNFGVQIHISDEVLEYIVRLIGATRNHPKILQGGSPRAALALAAISRAYAFLHDRDYVIPEDVQRIFRDTVTHRLIPAAGGGAELSAAVGEILRSVTPPKIR